MFNTIARRMGGVAASVLLIGAALALDARARNDGDRTEDVSDAIRAGRADNVILFLGDGMGDSEITIARNYTVGAAGRLALDELPLTGQMTTYSVFPDGKPDYDPESASTSTCAHMSSRRFMTTCSKAIFRCSR